MHRRVLILVVTLLIAVIGGASILAQDSPTATPGASSPEASPDASPGASPVASPVVAGNAANGQALAVQCIGCHSIDGSTIVGPSWKDLYGHEVELEDGTIVIADDAYLAQSITDPMSQIVKGFPPAMPPYAHLSESDIADLIAYIRSLSQDE